MYSLWLINGRATFKVKPDDISVSDDLMAGFLPLPGLPQARKLESGRKPATMSNIFIVIFLILRVIVNTS